MTMSCSATQQLSTEDLSAPEGLVLEELKKALHGLGTNEGTSDFGKLLAAVR